MSRLAHSRKAKLRALLLFSTSLCVACHEPTVHQVNRPSRVPEEVRKLSRERLFAEIKEEQAVEARLRQVGPGSPASAVLAEFGKPVSTTPCTEAATCWYYDLNQQKYFVCFNAKNVVVCNGRASPLHQRHSVPPPN